MKTYSQESIFNGKLINSGLNAKTIKSDKASKFITSIMYLAPADIVEGINLCPMATIADCKAACLFTAGRGGMNNVQKARVKKTIIYRDDRAAFMAYLVADLETFIRFCHRRDKRPACRLNGTSDIQFERGHACKRNGVKYASIFEAFPEVQFYDYTKIAKRVRRQLPANYSLVLSYSEANQQYARDIAAAHKETKAGVAVVYRTKELRDAAVIESGGKVIDGDNTDLRFLDPADSIVGLYAKGKAKTDQTGFVVDSLNIAS